MSSVSNFEFQVRLSGIRKGAQSFAPLSKCRSYLNPPLCGTKKKMSYLTRDFTKSGISGRNQKSKKRKDKNFYRHSN